jgi:hypothetical protein
MGSGDGLFRHRPADVDAIIGDHPEPDPTFHAGLALVSAAVETVATLDHADAPPHPVRHYVEFRTMSRILVLALLFGRFRNNYTT